MRFQNSPNALLTRLLFCQYGHTVWWRLLLKRLLGYVLALLSCILSSFPSLNNTCTYRISVKKAGPWRRFIIWMSLSLASIGSYVNYTLDAKRYCVHRCFKKTPRCFSLDRLRLILIFQAFPLECQRPESLWRSEHFSKVKYVTKFFSYIVSVTPSFILEYFVVVVF